MATTLNRELFLEEWEDTKKVVTKYFDSKKTFLNTVKLTREDLGEIYKNAYEAFKIENYVNAENLFYSLFIFDFKEYDYQIGLAATYEAQEKFESAVAMYMLAMMTTKPNPEILFRTGKCMLAMGEKKEAQIMFELVSEETMSEGVNNFIRQIAVEKAANILELIKD